LSSSAAFHQSLRRLKPEKRLKGLVCRDRSQLPFLKNLKSPLPKLLPKLLLDTTVYIDALQGRLPDDAEVALRAGSLWHSSVTEAELAALAGLLDPAHPDTASVIAQVAASIDLRPEHRILTPDRNTWREAGILAGLDLTPYAAELDHCILWCATELVTRAQIDTAAKALAAAAGEAS